MTPEETTEELDPSTLGDARPEIPEVQQMAGAGTIVYKSLVRPGETIQNPAVIQQGGQIRHVRAAPPLTAQEQTQASAALEELMPALEADYPQLTAALLANPNSLFLLPEIQLMLQDQGSPASHDLTAEVLQGILEDPASDGVIGLYQTETRQNETQQVFWKEVGDLYGEEAKEGFVTLLAQLSEDGADNVASLAMAWSEERDMSVEENQAQLILNMWQWAYARQQSELGEEGIFGFLDAPQEFVEDVLVRPVVDGLVRSLGSPEEAARRKGLTLGQQAAYQFGIRPPDSAGEFGMWNNVSGSLDAFTELGLDPLNVLAGVGAGLKAAKTVPVAAKATRAGRLATAARALLPKPFTGAARVNGGRVARVIYSFKSKSYDDLLDGLAKAGKFGRPAIADDIAKLVKNNNIARLTEKYPQFSKMTEEMYDAIALTETPEEVVEVLRHGNLRDVLNRGREVADLELEAAQAWQRVATAVGDDVDPKDISSIMSRSDLPRDLTLDAIKKQVSLDTMKMRPNEAFIITDIPARPRRTTWSNTLRSIKGEGRVATGTRQAIARVTPGKIPEQVHLFETRKGMKEIRDLMSHYGVEQSRIDDVVNEFVGIELGARQDWFFDNVIRSIGEATGVPVLQHDLLTFYKGTGIRAFSASGGDMWTDAVGTVHRGPLLPTHMTDTVPIPVQELDSIVRRARAISNPVKRTLALQGRGRGLLGSTKSNRSQLVNRFRNALTEKGEDVSQYSDEQLWQMAYSYVAANGDDGRGWISGTAMPKLGSVWDGLHRFFTKSMLVLRPVQWAWRVTVMEEPLRAAVFNLPSMYRNPLGYMADARTAHYMTRLQGWRQANLAWSDDAYQTITSGLRGVDDGMERLRSLGLTDIFDDVPASMTDFRTGIAGFLDDSVRNRTRLKKLEPIKSVPFMVKRRADRIAKAESKLTAMGLPSDFDLVDDIPEIQQKLTNVYLAGAVGGSDSTRAAQWARGMPDQGARNYGTTWGRKLVELVEDPYGKMALRRYAAELSGDAIPGAVNNKAVVSHSRWQMMRSELQQRYPDIEDDLELAGTYMDDLLRGEIDTLFAPLLANKLTDEQAHLIDTFVRSRQLETDLDGISYAIDLSSRNVGAGTRKMGELAVDLKNTKLPMPQNIPAPSFDPRFMENDAGALKKLGDMVLQTFGEKATQVMNRRPAWVSEYRRWYQNYTKLGIPEDVARKAAQEHASQMINYVYYNIDEAPFLVEKMNRALPFFGATYEVLSAWTYKMPASVGGSWLFGAGEFGRKFRRLMDAFVNLGLVTREEQEDGSITHTLNLRPRPTTPEEAVGRHPNEMGLVFNGMAFNAVHTAEATISAILQMEDGLGLREGGIRLSVGDPLDPTDYGILSFAQANLGLNPQTNFLLTKAAALLPGAAGPDRTIIEPGETLADVAERYDIDVLDLARLNRAVFFDNEEVGKLQYLALMAGRILPEEISLPEGTPLELPDTDVFSNVIADIYAPFGTLEDPKDLLLSWVPGAWRWGLAGLALQNQPTDSFYSGEYEGLFAGLLPDANLAQMSSQLSEAFMYVETHNRLPSGESRFERILRLGKEAEALPPGESKDEALADIEQETEDYLTLVQKTAHESLFLRSLVGQMMPTTPGHVRAEQELIQGFWAAGDYADSVRIGDGDMTIQPFRTTEEMDNFFEQVSAWLDDPTGDSARAEFREAYPTIMPYLTPKTYWEETGIPPEVASFEEYQRQIESGERVMAPLHVTMFKAKSSAIQADYYNQFAARYGKNPERAAAAALWDREGYQALQEERNLAYQILNMQDDMHGGLYDQWRQEQYGGDSFEQAVEELRTIQDNLAILFELEADLDVEIDLEGIQGLGGSIRAAISEISTAIDQYEELGDAEDFDRNPFEAAIHQYFQEVYFPYKEGEAALYDELGEMTDQEQVSLQYERIKLYKEEAANTTYFLNNDTTTPYPSPLEYRWLGYTEEDRTVKAQQWMTRPVRWMDLDQSLRIIETNPLMSNFLPSDDQQFQVYRDWTLQDIEIEEMLEDNAITTGQATKLRDKIEEEVRVQLLAEGRAGEVAFMDMTPFEKLEVGGVLPPALGIFGDYVRYYKEALAAAGTSSGSIDGRQIVAPLYEHARMLAHSDPQVMEAFQQVGEDLFDRTNLDQIFPQIFFGSRQEW